EGMQHVEAGSIACPHVAVAFEPQVGFHDRGRAQTPAAAQRADRREFVADAQHAAIDLTTEFRSELRVQRIARPENCTGYSFSFLHLFRSTLSEVPSLVKGHNGSRSQAPQAGTRRS